MRRKLSEFKNGDKIFASFPLHPINLREFKFAYGDEIRVRLGLDSMDTMHAYFWDASPEVVKCWNSLKSARKRVEKLQEELLQMQADRWT